MTKYYFNVSNRPFAVSNKRHFTTMTKILEGFASLCKYLNLTGATKLKYEKKNEKNSARSSKMTPSCKWPIELYYINTRGGGGPLGGGGPDKHQ